MTQGSFFERPLTGARQPRRGVFAIALLATSLLAPPLLAHQTFILPDQFIRNAGEPVELALTSALADAEVDSAGYPLRLNDLIVQRYPPGCTGITPHRDHVRYGFLIAIILLTGDGHFGVCHDRQGNESREIDFKPGDLLLMGGPGLVPNFTRPFHYVNGVTDSRRTIGLRYDMHKSDA